MPQARSTLVSLDEAPYYHCTCRCVRRVFLWGTDHLTSRDYSHRKQWVIDRLEKVIGASQFPFRKYHMWEMVDANLCSYT